MNFIDSIIGFINPAAGLERMQKRMAMDAVREYNAATSGRRKGNLRNRNTNASSEVGRFANKLSGISQELVRNNPLAQRIKMIYASNIVGQGITADITSNNTRVGEDFTSYFEEWANSTDCDFDGHNTLSGLLWLLAASVVESGGCFIRFHIDTSKKFPLQLQLIEQTYLDPTMDKRTDEELIINGVKYTSDGKIDGYWIDIDPSGTNQTGVSNRKYYRKDVDILHVFRRERPGQHLGVSWLAQIATHLDRYDTLQDAKVMQQQIAACLAVLIEDAPTAMGNKTENPLIDKIEPGMIEYVPAGSNAKVITPPRADDSQAFIVELKGDMAVGSGLNYQQLTGDYSKFNFASGRMGLIEFNRYLDGIQQFMLVPQLNKIMAKVFTLYQISKGTNTTIKTEWVFPPRATVNPKEEVETEVMKVRSALSTPQVAAKKFGTKLEKVVDSWNDAYRLMGNLPFDIRPDKFSAAGNQLDQNDAASSNSSSNDSDDSSTDSEEQN
ncbi:portal protein [Alteromonas phage JH01]|nr:portal protein [Alteromonas phage JH01]